MARGGADGIRGAESTGDDGARSDDVAQEVGEQVDVELRRVANGWPVRSAESQQVDRIDRVARGERVDHATPFVRRGRGVNAVDEEECRAVPPNRVRDPVPAPRIPPL